MTSRLSLQWFNSSPMHPDLAWRNSGWTFGNLGAWKRAMNDYRHSLAKYPARLVNEGGDVVWSGGKAE
jgi:hypothetical protein